MNLIMYECNLFQLKINNPGMASAILDEKDILEGVNICIVS